MQLNSYRVQVDGHKFLKSLPGEYILSCFLRQVSEKERKLQYDTLFKDIASVLVSKCVNSETNRPYTISMLERSLRDIHFAVDPKRGAKQQALDVCPNPKP